MRSAPANSLCGRLLREDRGAATAEFAIVLPVVIAVLGLVIGGTVISAHRISLVAQAGELARAEARGDTAAAGGIEKLLARGVDVAREERGVLHCVALSSAPAGGLLRAVSVRAESCAARLGDER